MKRHEQGRACAEALDRRVAPGWAIAKARRLEAERERDQRAARERAEATVPPGSGPVAVVSVEVARTGRVAYLVVARCPFCSERHTHGGGDERSIIYGWRESHCANRGRRGVYYLLPPGDAVPVDVRDAIERLTTPTCIGPTCPCCGAGLAAPGRELAIDGPRDPLRLEICRRCGEISASSAVARERIIDQVERARLGGRA